MMRKLLVVGLLLLFSLTPAVAQVESEHEQVLAAVQIFFDAMTAADSVASSQVLLSDGYFSATRQREEQVVVNHSSFREYLAGLSENSSVYLERMWNPKVTIKGWLAVVTTPYDFHIDGEFSHCGTDVFNLVKIQGKWKIASAIYTVEPTGCPPSPLGNPN